MSFKVYKTGMIQFVGLSGSGQGPIVGATNIVINPGLKEVEGTAAGQITPSFVGILTAEPTVTATIYDMGTMVKNGLAAAPLPFGSTQTCTSVVVWGVQAQEDGTIVVDAGNSNAQVGEQNVIAQGLAIFTSSNARQGSPATAQITIYCESTDGTTNPITFTDAQDLPSIPVLGQMYTLGQAEVNGTTIASTNSMDYSANWKVERKSSNGVLFSTMTYASEFKPRLTIGCYDTSLYGTYTGLGTALTSSTFAAYYQAIAPNATRVAAATAAHIKFAGSASQGMIWPEQVNLQPDSSEIRLHICPVVGSSPVLAISVAAIT